MSFHGEALRLLIVPGLHDSGPGHWQTLLQRQHRGARRVQQRDWSVPDVERWADRVIETLAEARAHEPHARWVAVAHSFGCLALARALLRGATGLEAALLVAPADPLKFGVTELLPCRPLPLPCTLVASRSDSWMPFGSAVSWSRVWGSRLVDAGDAGHINVASGHGTWPLGQQLVERHIQQLQRARRIERAHPLEFSFSV